MHSFNDTTNEMTSDIALRFKAHEALDTVKKILRECYVNTTDSNDEDGYRYVLENLSEAKDNLPSLPKGNSEDRRREKEQENFY